MFLCILSCENDDALRILYIDGGTGDDDLQQFGDVPYNFLLLATPTNASFDITLFILIAEHFFTTEAIILVGAPPTTSRKDDDIVQTTNMSTTNSLRRMEKKYWNGFISSKEIYEAGWVDLKVLVCRELSEPAEGGQAYLTSLFGKINHILACKLFSKSINVFATERYNNCTLRFARYKMNILL